MQRREADGSASGNRQRFAHRSYADEPSIRRGAVQVPESCIGETRGVN